jgi:hypothetical protein
MDITATKKVLTELILSDWGEMTEKQQQDFNSIIEWAAITHNRFKNYTQFNENVPVEAAIEMNHWNTLLNFLENIRDVKLK